MKKIFLAVMVMAIGLFFLPQIHSFQFGLGTKGFVKKVVEKGQEEGKIAKTEEEKKQREKDGTTTTSVAAPSNLYATAVSSTQINLTWQDNSTNEIGFKIERKTGVGGTYSQIVIANANMTSYSNTGLTASTTYYYRIRAYNSAGNSSYSNETNATTLSASLQNNPPTISSLTANPTSVSSGGESTITCSASDIDGDTLNYIWTKTGGTILGTDSQISWTAPSSTGTYTITCTVSDGRGGSAQQSVNVIVDNPPSVSITNPSNNSTVLGTVNVTASASDDNGISKVEFYIDGSLKYTDNSSPYNYSWDTTAESEGFHTVKVIAYDTANQTASAQHTVKVDNLPIQEGEWEIVDDDLVRVGTGGGHYLEWPRDRYSEGCYNNGTKQWKTSETAGQPTWDDVNKCYNYPVGESSNDYPAFKWAENLVYKGYDDWRLPAEFELIQLSDYGKAYITYGGPDNVYGEGYSTYWASEEANEVEALRWKFTAGWSASTKTLNWSVRAVRSDQ